MEFGPVHFPNEQYCGPKVTLCAYTEFGTLYHSCCIKTTYRFPNLSILPDRTGSLFAKRCKIEAEAFQKAIDLIPEKPSEFFTFVDSSRAIAHTSVFWEYGVCPGQDQTVIGHGPIRPYNYFDYCGKYFIMVESVYPSPQGYCRVESDEYPIPNWNITKTDTGCKIQKVNFLEFFIFVDSPTERSASATVSWEDAQQCPFQMHQIYSLPNPQFLFAAQNVTDVSDVVSLSYVPFLYYNMNKDTCGKYTITATFDGATYCRTDSDEYPIPNWRLIKFPGNCTIVKIA